MFFHYVYILIVPIILFGSWEKAKNQLRTLWKLLRLRLCIHNAAAKLVSQATVLVKLYSYDHQRRLKNSHQCIYSRWWLEFCAFRSFRFCQSLLLRFDIWSDQVKWIKLHPVFPITPLNKSEPIILDLELCSVLMPVNLSQKYSWSKPCQRLCHARWRHYGASHAVL